ncbi:MAG: TIGR03118 family protein [Acidobacteriia bacterium]|nr:TIGR03118 family protein [Terriglobia bacterium]
MHIFRKNCKWLLALSLLSALAPTVAFAQQYNRTDLVSSIPGDGTNPLNGHDTQLVNSWGLTRSAASAWWISDNGTGLATVYNGVGNKALTVTIPVPQGINQHSSPTGVVANGTGDFALPGSTAAKFIFVTEEGTIAAWNGGAAAVIVKDNSDKGAVYKGVTIAEWNGKHFLYAANFHSGEIEVYDSTFQPVKLDDDAFRGGRDNDSRDYDRDRDDRDGDRRGFAPFNVQAIGTNLYVSYAKQDAAAKDEVDGAGLGFVNIFSPGGKRLAHLQSGPWFNAPWGMSLAPGEFGEFSHSLLVGMFGSGQIAAFNPVNGHFLGLMRKSDNSTLTIDGLWALAFGAGNANSGPYNTLFFTAGPNNENDGTFGTLVPVATELNEIDEP